MPGLISRTQWKYLVWDCLCWVLAVALVAATYYRFEIEGALWFPVIAYVVTACVMQVIVGTYEKVYLGRYRHGSFDESFGIARTWMQVSVITALVYLILPRLIGTYLEYSFPYALMIIAPLAIPIFFLSPRWVARRRRRRRRDARSKGKPVLIYGAGDSGAQVARLLRTDSDAPYRAVGFIDDDLAKRNSIIEGVRVLGTGKELEEVAKDREVEAVVLAITAAKPSLITSTEERLAEHGIDLKIVPPAREILGGRLHLSDMRDINVSDLLGRRQVQTDITSVAAYLKGKRILVTGGGGSIGSELVRQIHNFGPERLVILDRDEGGLHATQLKVYGQALLNTRDVALVSIRDREALDNVFAMHRPEVVFHAAALKHLPLLEQYPDEGWKTNVIGTANVLECAARYGVETFVNVSTDKAADATSVLGKTKRCAEYITSWYGMNYPGRFISVRFGNVLGSRGSMLHTFTQQIERGGPITVTHPEVTRYFMTIPEACELVIQSGAIGTDGDVTVLDMGEPVRILDVAKHLIERSGKKIEIVFTGLRPGEKMHEVLFDHGDETQDRVHPMISHVSVKPLSPAEVNELRPTLLGPAAKGTAQGETSQSITTSKVYS